MKLGLLGNPVTHSLSPLIHAVFMDSAKISGEYSLHKVEAQDLKATIDELFSQGFTGLNITIPHKRRVVEFCDTLSPAAKSAGAVNTLFFTGGIIEGHNTDVSGFASFASKLPSPFFVLGGGGAAMAAAAAVPVGECILLGRGGAIPLSGRPVVATVVNATPLGWNDDDHFPVDIPEGWFFADLNYNPRWRWRNSLSSEGGKVITGEGMLVEQAACSFSLWTGFEVSEETRINALERIKAVLYGQD
jgi:shikimate dehydrogenase